MSVLRLHAPDQLPDLFTHLRSSRSTMPGPPPPKQPESSTMPANDGLRLHDDQGLGPAGPQASERNPKQPIKAIQLGTGPLPLENSELLAKSGGFQSEVVARHKEGAEVCDHRENERDHRSNVIQIAASGARFSPVRNRLILFANGILMTDS